VGRTADDEVLRELNAPDPGEAMEALGYWITRHRALPFYRRSARREAERMIAFWQGRTLRDVTRAPRAAIATGEIVAVAGLVAGYHGQRVVGRVARYGLLCCLVIGVVLVLGPRLI
jgi:hypothetical protein